MRSFARITAVTAFGVFLVPAFSAPIVSESRITMAGGAFSGETYVLSRADGDWYVTPNDAHAGLALRPAASAAHQATFNIDWDGKALAQTINSLNNDAANNQRFAFYLHLLAPYNQTLQPKGADAVEITVVKMDDLNLEANISGTATGTGPGAVRITGVLKLHRDRSDQGVSGTFGDCDPGIHDKLVGAEWRSPSECERKFDSFVRSALSAPFAGVESAFSQGDWAETVKPKSDPLTAIPRHSESKPFKPVTVPEYRFQLRPESEQAKRNQAVLQTTMSKMADAMKSPSAAEAFQAEVTKATHAVEGSGTINIRVGMNSASVEIYNFQGAYAASQIPGVGYSVSAPFVQSRGGGDIGASHETTYVFLGPWLPATGSNTNISVKAALNPKAPTLTVQNIFVEIQANAELAQKVIKLTDWNALKLLIAK